MLVRVFEQKGLWFMARSDQPDRAFVLNPAGEMRDGVLNVLCFMGVLQRDEKNDPVLVETEIEVLAGEAIEVAREAARKAGEDAVYGDLRWSGSCGACPCS